MFNVAKEEIILRVNGTVLKEGGQCQVIDEWGISIGMEREPELTLKGVLAMVFNNDYMIDFNINSCCLFSTMPVD